MTSSGSALNRIPVEMCEEITSWLTISEIAGPLRRVSQRWHKVSKSEGAWMGVRKKIERVAELRDVPHPLRGLCFCDFSRQFTTRMAEHFGCEAFKKWGELECHWEAWTLWIFRSVVQFRHLELQFDCSLLLEMDASFLEKEIKSLAINVPQQLTSSWQELCEQLILFEFGPDNSLDFVMKSPVSVCQSLPSYWQCDNLITRNVIHFIGL